MHQIISIKPRFCFGGTTVDGRMYFQRRGISNQLEYGNKEHKFYVIRYPNGDFNFSFKDDQNHLRFTAQEGIAAVELAIAENTGASLKFAPETMAYCYSSSGVQVEKEDVFFSSIFYCDYSDTVRHAPTNTCIVAFKEGKFSDPDFDVDHASGPFQSAVQRALKKGFHKCDTDHGDDYCKRRLAWLAGAYLIEDSVATEIKVAVLGRDMSSKPRLSFA